MDNLTNRLVEDAKRIDADISPQLDARINASLNAVQPERPAGSRPSRRPSWYWLAGGIGATAALLLVAVMTVRQPEMTQVPVTADTAKPVTRSLPVFDFDAETTEFVGPLSAELSALQADLRKAEQIVREDIGI